LYELLLQQSLVVYKMPKTHHDIRERVLDRVRTATLDRMCDYVKRKKPTLRGNEGEEYLTACVLVALYKDTHAVSYTQLLKDIK